MRPKDAKTESEDEDETAVGEDEDKQEYDSDEDDEYAREEDEEGDGEEDPDPDGDDEGEDGSNGDANGWKHLSDSHLAEVAPEGTRPIVVQTFVKTPKGKEKDDDEKDIKPSFRTF